MTPASSDPLGAILGSSRAIQAVRDQLRRYGPTRARVLIEGENGTGKELAAQALHALSKCHTGPFIAISCAELDPALARSDLMGSRRGAFTGAVDRRGAFELAARSTLFLDEVADLALDVQRDFLRAFEAGIYKPLGAETALPFECRIVTASQRPLRALVQERKFRMDLYQRLAMVTISLPPLRDRVEDIPEMADAFLRAAAEDNEVAVAHVAPSGLRILGRHTWEGNIRELRNLMTRLAIDCPGGEITATDIDARLSVPTANLGDRQGIVRVLQQRGGNVSLACRDLGVRRQSLHRIMKRLGIPRGTGRAKAS